MSLFEFFSRFIGYDITSSVNKIKAIQSYSPDELQEWQNNKKWKIAKYHYYNNTFYRKKVGRIFPNKWDDLPILEKSDYQDQLESLISKDYKKKNLYIANTSGSSGHPFFFAKNKEAHAISWALVKDRYSWHGINLNSKQARFYGIPLETTTKLEENVKDWIMNRVRFPIFDMSNEILKKYLVRFYNIKFEYIYGYTNSLVLFAHYLIKNQIVLVDICPSLKVCIPTSEMLTKEDRLILNKGFGVKVINEYGVSEVGGIVAFEDENFNWRLSTEAQYVEILDEKSGPIKSKKSGDIIITSLHNEAMPLIRYRVGDIGALDNNNQVLENLLGRTNDNIILPSGKTAPGLTFYYISKAILESADILKEFIIRQISLDTFVFDVVSDKDLSEGDINEIKMKMDIYLEPGLKLRINRVSKINRPSSGKIKHFYSEIDS